MVKYFREYSLQTDADSKIDDSMIKNDMELEDLMKGFQPQDEHTDRVMLYMLTGRNLENAMKDWCKKED